MTAVVPMLDDIDSLYEAPLQPPGWTRVVAVMSERVVDTAHDEILEAAKEFEGEAAEYMGALVRAKAVPFSTTFDLCPACLATTLGPLHAPLLQRLKQRADEPDATPLPSAIPFPRRPAPPPPDGDLDSGLVIRVEASSDEPFRFTPTVTHSFYGGGGGTPGEPGDRRDASDDDKDPR